MKKDSYKELKKLSYNKKARRTAVNQLNNVDVDCLF